MAKGTLNLNYYSDVISMVRRLISLATQLFVLKAYLDREEETIHPELSNLCIGNPWIFPNKLGEHLV